MTISLFEIFSIGIGPSSSHTVGPMRAAYAFVKDLENNQLLERVQRVQIELYGSLALTGRGHATDRAVLGGLEGEQPHLVDPIRLPERVKQIVQHQQINLAGKHSIPFYEQTDLKFHQKQLLPLHTNGMRFTALNSQSQQISSQIYYSIGGGFIVTDAQFGKASPSERSVPYPFQTAKELFQICRENSINIAELMFANEQALHPEKDIKAELLHIVEVMKACVERGCQAEGMLPGGLAVQRRAPALYQKLKNRETPKFAAIAGSVLWPTVFAMAVNEENAAGGRIVTAPTNGAAGIIPAVLSYYQRFYQHDKNTLSTFILTAGAIALLYKLNASISGAEVGCQGEVGVACSMAAGALTAVLGGSLEQIENAAEMAMEHHLGMTCDPVAGLVQIPCIERNGVGAEKAIKLAYLALMEDGKNKKVSLDKVIETMYATGKDMLSNYKETSLGGLAKSVSVNITEC